MGTMNRLEFTVGYFFAVNHQRDVDGGSALGGKFLF
jgi:hypothetical protein